MRPELRAWFARGITVVVLAAAVIGAVVLSRSLTAWIAVGIAVFAVIATAPWGRHVLAAVCAAVIALLGLVALAVGIRALLDLLSVEGRLPIWLGLVLALAVFFGVALWYLHGNWLGTGPSGHGPTWFTIPSPRWGWTHSFVVAAALAIAVVILLPLGVGLLEPKPQDVAKAQRVVSQIDVLIVSATPRAPASSDVVAEVARSGRLAPFAHAAGFDVRYSVGFAAGDGVRWTLAGTRDEAAAIAALGAPDAPAAAAPPEPLNDADRVLLLLVDGTPAVVEDPAALPNVRAQRGEVARWRRIAQAAAASGTPSYALLETRRQARLRQWSTFARRGTYVKRGGPVSFQRLGSRSVADAAVRLAVAAPTAQEDFTLALKYRPILRFDDGEGAPRPLSVEDLFATRKVKLCSSRRVGGTECAEVPNSAALENGGTHLELPLPRARTLRRLAREDLALQAAGGTPVVGRGSAIYVHPVPAETEESSLLYLDYWWYLPYNPSGSGEGAFCGPGLVIPGISCFDHVSDWEGVTVVLDRTTPGRAPEPVAVHYAQHDSVVRYDVGRAPGGVEGRGRYRHAPARLHRARHPRRVSAAVPVELPPGRGGPRGAAVRRRAAVGRQHRGGVRDGDLPEDAPDVARRPRSGAVERVRGSVGDPQLLPDLLLRLLVAARRAGWAGPLPAALAQRRDAQALELRQRARRARRSPPTGRRARPRAR